MSDNAPKITHANYEIARTIAECLNKHYPGHAWAVQANVETGLVQVYNLSLSGQWGFVLKMDTLANDPSMKLTIMAGGEILERYNLSRGAANQAQLQDLQFDFKGDAIRHD